jgi:hypothetical protein
MKRFITLIAMLVMLASTSFVFADSPHFIKASASFSGNSANLDVSWKEAGLGNNQLITYVASANASATYACINGGGNHPKAANKETVNGPVTASGQFSSGKNGQIEGTLTISPPSAGSFSCPSGQNLVIAKVAYSNVAITDTTNGVSEPIGGTFCRQFVNLAEFAC